MSQPGSGEAGQRAFACLMLVGAVALLVQLGGQTQWVNGAGWLAQPGFWPAVSLAAMAGFGAGHTLWSLVKFRASGEIVQMLQWFRSVEYAIWFLAYVYLVPLAGYLPATLAFTILLAVRAGYRRRGMLIAATGGLLIVVLFKSVLRVKIPGGQIYESLPDTMRAFMINYL